MPHIPRHLASASAATIYLENIAYQVSKGDVTDGFSSYRPRIEYDGTAP